MESVGFAAGRQYYPNGSDVVFTTIGVQEWGASLLSLVPIIAILDVLE